VAAGCVRVWARAVVCFLALVPVVCLLPSCGSGSGAGGTGEDAAAPEVPMPPEAAEVWTRLKTMGPGEPYDSPSERWFLILINCHKALWDFLQTEPDETSLRALLDRFGREGWDADFRLLFSDYYVMMPRDIVPDRRAEPQGLSIEGWYGARKAIHKAQIEMFLHDPARLRRYYHAVLWNPYWLRADRDNAVEESVARTREGIEQGIEEERICSLRNFLVLLAATDRLDLIDGGSMRDLERAWPTWLQWYDSVRNDPERRFEFDLKTVTWRPVNGEAVSRSDLTGVPGRLVPEWGRPQMKAVLSMAYMTPYSGRWGRYRLYELGSRDDESDTSFSIRPAATQPVSRVAQPPVTEEQIEAARKAGVAPLIDVDLGDSVSMKMILIPSGTFTMGPPDGRIKGYRGVWTQHDVTISRPFYIGVTEVTRAQWKTVVGEKSQDAWAAGARRWQQSHEHVAGRLHWRHVQAFIQNLNKKDAGEFRLPTEAEWEYACRAGSRTAYFFGDDPDQLDRYAVGGPPALVARRLPNRWGLLDMYGNAAEWCRDWYGAYPDGPVTDPAGPTTGWWRVRRGARSPIDGRLSGSAWRGRGRVKYETAGFRCVGTIQIR